MMEFCAKMFRSWNNIFNGTPSISWKTWVMMLRRSPSPFSIGIQNPMLVGSCCQSSTADHDDPFFYGHKIIHYPDGSKQLVGDENCATSCYQNTSVFKVPCSIGVPSVIHEEDEC